MMLEPNRLFSFASAAHKTADAFDRFGETLQEVLEKPYEPLRTRVRQQNREYREKLRKRRAFMEKQFGKQSSRFWATLGMGSPRDRRRFGQGWKPIRLIKQVELQEFSVRQFPMNPEAAPLDCTASFRVTDYEVIE